MPGIEEDLFTHLNAIRRTFQAQPRNQIDVG
jgi:hypothetical protein